MRLIAPIFFLAGIGGAIILAIGAGGWISWLPTNSVLSNGIETTATLQRGEHRYPKNYSKNDPLNSWLHRTENEVTLLFSDAQGIKRRIDGVKITDRFFS